MSKKTAEDVVVDKDSKSGFYLYDDGASYWGINVLRFGKAGVEIAEELHKKTVDEKLSWLKEYLEKKAEEEKKAAEAKKE